MFIDWQFSDVLTVTGVGYFISIIGFHLGLWLYRHRPEVQWGWLTLEFFILTRRGLFLLESTVAQRLNQGIKEYVVTLRDISDRRQVIS